MVKKKKKSRVKKANTADDPPVEGAAKTVYLLGTTPGSTNAEVLGAFKMAKGMMHAKRHVYAHESQKQIELWHVSGMFGDGAKGKWFIGPKEARGQPGGYLSVSSAAMAPEEIDGVWQVATGSGKLDAPDLRCVGEIAERKDPHEDGKFVDDAFPPKIALPTKDLAARVACWIRAADLVKEPVLYAGGIHPCDIVQGGVGDCWLSLRRLSNLCARRSKRLPAQRSRERSLCRGAVAAFACVAEFPSLIESLFREDGVSESGSYTVRLYCPEAQAWQAIVIDDTLPSADQHNPRPVFAAPVGGELWVPLLEKAFAKYAQRVRTQQQNCLLAALYSPVAAGR